MENRKFTRKSFICIILSIVFILPLYWTIVTSLKGKSEIYAVPPRLWPERITLESYQKIFTINDGAYIGYFFNSVIITALTVLLVLAISVLAGYGFSKVQIKGKGLLLASILAAMMIPFQALLNPLYTIMSTLGLLNSIPGVMLIYATFQLPFCIFMMKNAFDMLPQALRESTKLDGAGELRSFFTIHLPLTLPSVATIAVYSAYTTWNDYLIALVFANSSSIKTFNVALSGMALGQYSTDWGLLTAGGAVGLMPILILFIFLQKYFVKGIMSGAIK